ncbi:MAG: ABC transporter permease [Burkholderiales bacterium]|nr:ABC transporter permease [Phycisphaerae bacterium]
MTAADVPLSITTHAPPPTNRLWRRALRMPRVLAGLIILGIISVFCVGSSPWTLDRSSAMHFDAQNAARPEYAPALSNIELAFGTDKLGRPLLARCLLGGVISLAVGLASAVLAIVLGVGVGLLAGFRGGWVDNLLMRFVDILYSLPYVLLIILFKLALEEPLRTVFSRNAANFVVMFLAIGLVSWLTMARVIRGQVLSLRSQPFIEAARALGLTERRIFLRHLLPNLVGPIVIYGTLTVPQAILQESFLSFLGLGLDPLPSWGALASENRIAALNIIAPKWWLLVFPCLLLMVTLLSLNFLGDGLRDLLDPKREAAKL